MAGGHDNDPGFWPGFVAAIAGLVLGLLIMAMVLGISLFVLGQLASLADKKPVHGPEPRADASPWPPAEVAAQILGASPRDNRPTAPPPPSVSLAPEPVRPVATLEFVAQAVLLPRSAQQYLAESVQQATEAGVRHWRLEVQTDEQDLSRQRAAFLRLMAVRNVLLEAGVPVTDVVTRLIDVGPAANDVDRVQVFAVAPPRAP